MPHKEPVMDVIVGRCEMFHPAETHPEGNRLVGGWVAVEELVMAQGLGCGLGGLECPQGLLAEDAELDGGDSDVERHESEHSFDELLSMVCVLRQPTFHLQHPLLKHLHHQRPHPFYLFPHPRLVHRKLFLLNHRPQHVAVQHRPDEISHPSRLALESLVLPIEMDELEGVMFVGGEIPRRLELL